VNTKPTRTLFVINFDPINTRVTDLERHFDPFGKISNVRIRKNFAFVQFETQEDATKALDATHLTYVPLSPVLNFTECAAFFCSLLISYLCYAL
jgi:RNA recognition motif-containing protein